MIAKKTQLLTVAAALLIPCGAQANDIDPGSEFYSALKTANPIVIDGDLSEWSGATVLVDPRFSIPKGSASDPNVAGTFVSFEEHDGGSWTGLDDHSSSLQVVYDNDNLYVGIIVTDEYHENANNSGWNGDSVQLMIANEARDTELAGFNLGLGGVEGSLGSVVGVTAGTDVSIVRDAGAKLTNYEIKLSKESMSLAELTNGVQFGLGMAINDGDELTPGQKGWSGLGAHSIVFGRSPSETALITLVPEPSSIVLSMTAIGAILLQRRKRHR